MSKRPLDQKSPVRKRSSLKRPATKQTPQIPANTEATMHDSGNASILRSSDAAVQPDAATEQTPEIPSDARSTPVLQRCDSAVEPDAAIEHIGMAWLSTIDDVTLISTLEHFTSLSLRRFGQAVQHSCWCAFASSHNERLKLVSDHQIVQCACCVECQTIAPCCECY